MASGWGLLGLDPQALQQTPPTPQGIPTGVDQAATAYGLPSLSSVINGMQSGATGDAQAVGGMGSRIGSMLADMGSRTGDLVEKFRNGDINAGEFLKGAAVRAAGAAYDSAMAGPNFSQKFLAGQIDPGSEDAAGGAFNAAASVAGMSSVVPTPAGAIRMFGGPSAATADHYALKTAQSLERAGAERDHIWDATGWFKAPDGNWKFEIPDELSTIGTPKNAPPGYGQLHHDDLAQAYPSMWQNTGQSIREAPVTSGRYDALGDAIHAQGPTDTAQRSVALHEMQHAIQREENFARGDNPGAYTATDWEAAGRPMLSEAPNAAAAHSAWARDQYHRSAGEVEARNVQARMNMTPDQRFNTPPWLTQDVPDAQQIVKFGDGGPQMSVPIRAYHGSPHDFDRFDISKIGTGEGAQAFGHGLYFAGNEGVARSYRDALSGQPMPFLDGKPITANMAQPATAHDLAATVMSAADGDKAGALSHLDTLLDYVPQHAGYADDARALINSGRFDLKTNPGHMYEVGIKADPARMLDYDAPIASQSSAVTRFANRAGIQPETLQHLQPDPTVGRYGSGYGMAPTRGGDLIDALTQRGYDPAELSQDMRKKGIPGIQYYDAGSRTAGEGSRNYVTFSDDIVSILRKYGLAGLMGGGSALAALKQNKDGSGM